MIIYFFTGQKTIKEFIKKIIEIKNENIQKTKNNIKTIKLKIKRANSTKRIKKNPPIKKINRKKSSNKVINIRNSYSIYASNIAGLSDLNKLNNQASILKIKKNTQIKIKRNKTKNLSKSNSIPSRRDNKINKIKNNTIIVNDYELNHLKYKEAIILDKRTFFNYYISLIRRKHLILFSFIPLDDYNLMTIKISHFLISISTYFAIDGFFFDDKTMHQIYKDKRAYNIIEQISLIIYSSLISSTINILLRQLSLSEGDILSIKKQVT